MNKAISTIFALLVLISCNRDKFDFNKLQEIELNPEIWIPFGEVNLKLSDLKRDTTLITTDEDGFITIIIQKDSILRSTLGRALLIPDQDTTHIAALKDQPQQIDINFSVFDNAEIKRVYFDTLEFTWKMPANAPQGSEVGLQILGSEHQLGPIQFTIDNFSHTPNQFYTQVFYNGYIDLSKNNTTHNNITLQLSVLRSNPQTPTGTPIPFSIVLSNIKISGMEGFLGNTNIDLPVFNSALNLKGLERFRQGIFFKNPSMKLTILNESGLEIAYHPSINGANAAGSDITILEIPTITVGKSIAPGQVSSTQIVLDNSNSNLSTLLQKLPESLIASGSVSLNPSGKQNNFLRNTDQIIVNGTIEIPLEFSAKDMFFENEFQNFKFWNTSSVHIPEFVEFEFNSENGFPFDLSLSAVFLDSVSLTEIRTIELDVLKPATVNQDGRVQSSMKYISKLKLTDSDITALNSAKSLLLRVKINTPENGEKVVKIFDSYFFKTRISARAKLKIQPLR